MTNLTWAPRVRHLMYLFRGALRRRVASSEVGSAGAELPLQRESGFTKLVNQDSPTCGGADGDHRDQTA